MGSISIQTRITCELTFISHLLKAEYLALCLKFIPLFEEANKLIEKVRGKFSSQDEQFVRKFIAAWEISSPKILIKGNNTINEKGELTTRLVIPEKNLQLLTKNLVILVSRRFLTSWREITQNPPLFKLLV